MSWKGGDPGGNAEGSGAPGVEVDAYLAGKPLDAYLDPGERPEFVLYNDTKGMTVRRDGDEATISPGSDARAFAVLTDGRVHLLVGAAEEGADHHVGVPYTAVADETVKEGLLKSRLSVTTDAGDRYDFRVPRGTVLTNVEAFLDRAIKHWSLLSERLAEIRELVGEIESALDAGDLEEARSIRTEARNTIEKARIVVEEFGARGERMDRLVDDAERDVDRTVAREHRLRGDRHLETAEAARDRIDFAGAHHAYRRAIERFEDAATLAERHGFADAAERRERVARVETRLSELESTPVERAVEARSLATDVDEPRRAATAWAEALERYRTALYLAWGDGPATFDGDTERLRVGVEWVATNLLEARESLAADHESRGDDALDAGDVATARTRYRDAREQFERARDLAAEFRSGDPDALAAGIERLGAKLRGIERAAEDPGRGTATVDADGD